MLLLATAFAASANPVDLKTARQVGAKYLRANTTAKVANDKELQLATTYRTESGVAAFYVFNGPSCFVIVSADDCATPILGQSATHQFNVNDHAPALEEYLQGFVKQIEIGINSGMPALDTVAHQWEIVQANGLVRDDRATASAVAPLLTSKWGQGSNGYWYNKFCPTDSQGPNGHAITGCVATSMSQIMRYWRYPTSGTSSHSYTPNNYPSQPQYVNFANATYDYDNMPDELYTTSTTTQNNAIATLMWHCGVSVDMNYGPTSSGSHNNRADDAYETYFKYSSDLHYELKANYSDSDWLSMLKKDLNKGRPVQYGSTTHSFICDGYNSNNELHFNWGWYGDSNDYYALGALNPGGDYNGDNDAIFEIHPLCEDGNYLHSLPYHEDFEAGETEFECLTKYDYLNGLHFFRSSWTTHTSDGTVNPATGNMCAVRPYNPTNDVNDWLFLPPVFIQPGRDASTLTFKTYEQFAGDYQFEGVFVHVGTLTSVPLPSDFTQIWTQNSPSAYWKDVTIDIDDYQGQIVYFAFKYAGVNGHTWYIDDINITQTWAPCSDNTPLPFTDSFDSYINGCWYIIDGDESGDNRCWQWRESNQSAYHPFGQQDKPQVGWLISKGFFLQPGRDYTTLSFRSGSTESGTGMKNSVWISVDIEGVPYPGNFTQIWEDPAYSSDWTTYTIDLSAYQGHFVHIAFKYEGTCAHNWFIDNVNISEGWSPCSSFSTSYSENFNSGLGGCWYIIDQDRSGGSRCWQWDSDSQCAYHPYGQSGIQQVGWLISPKIWLSEDHGYKLSFNSRCAYSGPGRKSSVLIAVDKSGTPSTYDYTEIWVDPAYSPSWTNYEIDLSSYSGHYVNIAFKYEGTYAHNWFIDDFCFIQIPTYTITASAAPSSGGTVTGGGTYNEGTSVTLTATPNTGYNFVNWTKNGTQVSTNPTYTFTATSDGTYVAHFQMIPPTGPQLTVYPSATETSNKIPMYVYYFDDFTRAQHIMPASELTAMSGGQITAIKYYTNSDYIPYSSVSEIDFYLKEVSGTTLTNFVDKSTAQIVYHGTVDFTAAGNGGEVTILFTTPFNYNGGNLLVGCDNTTDAGYKNIWFIGETGHTGAAIYGSNTTSLANVTPTASSFLPKTTFYYTGGGGGAVTQTTSFTSGWNWWSGYVELDGANSLQSLENGLGTHGVMIKSQNNGYATYLAGYGWYGSLTSINNECTYQVKADAACTVSLSGNAANPASHPVTLTSGWTWVGYPVNASMSVRAATC